MVRDSSRNVERWVADVGKVLSKQGRTKSDLGGLSVMDAVQGSEPFVRECFPVVLEPHGSAHDKGSKISGMRRSEGGGLDKISSVMVRFMWNGVDHLGMGSKLLTQQEQIPH